MTQNWIATLALVAWPFIVLFLFASLRAVPAVLWAFLGAQMILPVGAFIKIPMIPQFDKESVPSIAALAGFLLLTRAPSKKKFRVGAVELLIVFYVVTPFMSSLTNGDTLSYGGTVLPGLTAYEGGSAVIAAIVSLVPFWLGRRLFRSSVDIFEIFRALVLAGLTYSLPLLFEIRFSPQLHNWLYGYHPSQFVQSVRDDGYRPMALMGHGLIAALFTCTAAVAAAALWRLKQRVSTLPLPAPTIYLSAFLVLCKSAAATVYAATAVPLILLASPRLQLRIAMLLVSLSLIYPILRMADLFPGTLIINTAAIVSEDRASSMRFRFGNEDSLLAHALERPFFGWGRYGRGRVYDASSGEDLSITDGRWIITLGQYGILGFLAEFGLLALPVFRASARLKSFHSMSDQLIVAALSFIVAIHMIDLLPNGFLSPWLMLLSGALLGRTEASQALATLGQKRLVPGSSPASKEFLRAPHK